jgi:diguanylate cyclase (GGDEF)-like protein
VQAGLARALLSCPVPGTPPVLRRVKRVGRGMRQMDQSNAMAIGDGDRLAANENARMNALSAFQRLDAQHGATFARYARMACAVTGAPAAAIMLATDDGPRLLGAHGAGAEALRHRPARLVHEAPVLDEAGVAIGAVRVSRGQVAGLTEDARALLAELAGSVATTLALYGSMRAICRMATTDSLTEAGNRTHFLHQLRAEAARARRGQTPLSVVYCDCDGFGMVNNTLGHAAGDTLLREITAAIRDALRVSDTLARLGGDEFGLILPETGPAAAGAIAGRILAACRRLTARYDHPVSVSFGVVTFLRVPEDVSVMIEAADAAMYDAKRDGRDRVVARVAGAGLRLVAPSAGKAAVS